MRIESIIILFWGIVQCSIACSICSVVYEYYILDFLLMERRLEILLVVRLLVVIKESYY